MITEEDESLNDKHDQVVENRSNRTSVFLIRSVKVDKDHERKNNSYNYTGLIGQTEPSYCESQNYSFEDNKAIEEGSFAAMIFLYFLIKLAKYFRIFDQQDCIDDDR